MARTWFLFVAISFVGWGVNRIKGSAVVIGQDTINFVIGALAATFALLAFAPLMRVP
jgi:hypothetical protein